MKERPPFKFSAQTRVGFSDTDAQGIVYYGRYRERVENERQTLRIIEEGQLAALLAASEKLACRVEQMQQRLASCR